MNLVKILCVLCVLCGEAFAIDRTAFTFVSYDLEVRVDPAGQAMSARGKIRLRNNSATAQSDLTLQISSSLGWRSITVNGKDVQYSENDYTTDIDHTGAVNEAIVKLPAPVPSGGMVELEIGYAGQIVRDAKRLTAIGVPEGTAARSDWDRIEEPVTVLRGVGYVAWYQVSVPAAFVSDVEYFSALAAWKERERTSAMKVNACWVSEEENLSVIANGTLEAVKREVLGATDEAATHGGCSLFTFSDLGSTVPTFAIGNYASLLRPAINVYHLPEHVSLAKDYVAAAEKVLPTDEAWFGAPKTKVTVVQLPDTNAVPFENGPMLFTPLEPLDGKALEGRMMHQLVHASFASSRPWIEEGLAHFATALLRERDGRTAAVNYMDQFLGPLQEAEKKPGEHGIATSDDELMYRIKAMFVWWMLRDMLGETVMRRALGNYRAEQDKDAAYIQRLLEAESKRNLEEFFDQWVYRDRGLPDFRITAVYPRQSLKGQYLVSVTVENLGNAGAEVPVFVRAREVENSARLWVPAKSKASIRIELPLMPTESSVNDGSVPESDTTSSQ